MRAGTALHCYTSAVLPLPANSRVREAEASGNDGFIEQLAAADSGVEGGKSRSSRIFPLATEEQRSTNLGAIKTDGADGVGIIVKILVDAQIRSGKITPFKVSEKAPDCHGSADSRV